jgi:hypothetical protein
VQNATSDESVGGRLREPLARSSSRKHTTVINDRTGRTVNRPKRLNTQQAAEWLGLPPATLRWYRHRGDRGPCSYQLGSRIFYDMSDLEQWEQEQKAKSSKGGAA